MAKKKTGRNKSASAKRKSVSARRTSARPAAPRGKGDQLVPVICSECYEDLLYDASVNSDGIVCPICEHSAQKPDGAQLHHIAEKRRQEKSAFTLNAAFTGVGLGAFGVWAFLMQNPVNAADDAKFWGPLGVSLLCCLLLVIFIFKYEGNRWETYF